nr:hypothetical protein [Mycobacterium lepraemurium]
MPYQRSTCEWISRPALLPARLRDWPYDRVATVRYRLFGKYGSRPLPAPEIRARFIED